MFRIRFRFNYGGVLLTCIASLATSLLFSLDDDVLTFAETLRAWLHVLIAGVAYAQQPQERRRMRRRIPPSTHTRAPRAPDDTP